MFLTQRPGVYKVSRSDRFPGYRYCIWRRMRNRNTKLTYCRSIKEVEEDLADDMYMRQWWTYREYCKKISD